MAEKDPRLETRKHARRRLVGAAALALVAAVVLPMVMDAEPKPITEDIPIRIPNPDATAAVSRPQPVKTVRSASESKAPPAPEVVPIETDGGSVKAVADSSRANKSAKPETPQVSVPTQKPVPSVVSSPSAAATARAANTSQSEPAPKSDPRREPKTESRPKPVEKPEGDVFSKAAPGAPVRADGESSRVGATKPADQAGPFVVQLGTFGDSDNARRVRDKAKSMGVDTHSEAVKAVAGSDGKDKLRVRAGPFPTRASAEAVRDKLVQGGLAAVVAVKQ